MTNRSKYSFLSRVLQIFWSETIILLLCWKMNQQITNFCRRSIYLNVEKLRFIVFNGLYPQWPIFVRRTFELNHIILFWIKMKQQKIGREDQSSLNDPSDQPQSLIFQTNPNIQTPNKVDGLGGLDVKYNHLREFIQELPMKLKCPVQIMISHPDIQVSQLQESINAERLLELSENTIRKMKNHKRLKKNWNKQDLTILLWVADKYNHLNNKSILSYKQDDWQNLSKFVPGKSGPQCMFKWLGLRKHHLTEHPWTLDQEINLKKLVEQKGQASWPDISQDLYLMAEGNKIFRSAKQCREHWTCYVNPNLKKGLWRPQQDLELLNQFIRLGKKWAQISKVLNGRTQNAIKNRFNLLMQKQGQLKGNANQNNRKDYALKIISQIQKTYNISSKLSQQFLKKQELLKSPQIKYLQKQPIEQFEYTRKEFKFFSDSPLPNNDFSELEVKIQNQEQSIVKRVKFCKVSLQGLMQMQGVIPAVFDRDTMQIFIDHNNSQ